MAKKSNLLSMLLGVALILALVYFLRPQTFDFLKQGFVNPDEEEDFEDFEDLEDEEGFEDIDDEEGFYTEGGGGSSGANKPQEISCKNKYNQIKTVKGTRGRPIPVCPDEYTKI
jgi:hypothetical protein